MTSAPCRSHRWRWPNSEDGSPRGASRLNRSAMTSVSVTLSVRRRGKAVRLQRFLATRRPACHRQLAAGHIDGHVDVDPDPPPAPPLAQASESTKSLIWLIRPICSAIVMNSSGGIGPSSGWYQRAAPRLGRSFAGPDIGDRLVNHAELRSGLQGMGQQPSQHQPSPHAGGRVRRSRPRPCFAAPWPGTWRCLPAGGAMPRCAPCMGARPIPALAVDGGVRPSISMGCASISALRSLTARSPTGIGHARDHEGEFVAAEPCHGDLFASRAVADPDISHRIGHRWHGRGCRSRP